MSTPSAVYTQRIKTITQRHEAHIARKNAVDLRWDNGLFERFVHPVIDTEHIPLSWRYDLDWRTNPHLIERLGINAMLNPGAIELNGKVHLMVRIEGNDRKSFFAVAESANGIDGFRFWDRPVIMPENEATETNIYDMRLTRHEDGWIYGIFCVERKDPKAPASDTSTAVASASIARTKDLVKWERFPDLVSRSQQRNVCLHPEFVQGKYLLYTRPQDGCVDVGSGGGIGWSLVDSMEKAVASEERIMDPRIYHTVKELKNGQGAIPVKTAEGWLHVAHGVRGCAAGHRYVVYSFLSDMHEPWKITRRPGGHLIAPWEEERVGDVSNVIFTCGMVPRASGELLIYYASSDTRCHVARTTIEKMLDYVRNTPEDSLRSAIALEQRLALIERNRQFISRG